MDAVSRREMDEAVRLVSDEAVDAFSVAGMSATCFDRLEAFARSGVDEPVLMIHGDGPERDAALGFLRRLQGTSGE